ncbi:MAG: hypothetical protein WDO70_00250 [Alphaproteobacteria bacterium]
MLILELSEKADDAAVNAILVSLKQDIRIAKDTDATREFPKEEGELFSAFLEYCDIMPDRIARGVELTKGHAERFLLHVKSLASSVLASLRTYARRTRDALIEFIERVKEYVVSIACKIWSIFSLIFKSLRELSLELGFGSEHGIWPLSGKVGLVFDNPFKT